MPGGIETEHYDCQTKNNSAKWTPYSTGEKFWVHRTNLSLITIFIFEYKSRIVYQFSLAFKHTNYQKPSQKPSHRTWKKPQTILLNQYKREKMPYVLSWEAAFFETFN